MKEQKLITVVVDAYGGDNAPEEIIKGAIEAVNEYGAKVILTGKEDIINELLKNYKYDNEKVEVVNAPDVVYNEDAPAVAIRTKKTSSLVVALDILKQNDNVSGLVSAGSTGAVLTGGFLKIGRLKGISRPALSPLLPNAKGGQTMLIDCGANMDTKPINLVHFAIMGTAYMEAMFGIKNPKVALLNVGVEDKKGNELTKATFPLLKEAPINFVGNMEARDALSGDYDIIVADGFAGNILLKSTEGSIMFLLDKLKKEIKKSFFSSIGALFMMGTFKKLKKDLSHNNKGGSPFLGAKKLIIKSHGSSDSMSIKTSIKQVIDLERAGMQKQLKKQIDSLEVNEG